MGLLCLACATVDPEKRYPHMVADEDPVPVGTIEAEFDQAFSTKVNKKEVAVFFYPRYNAVVLEYRYELIRYRQFWDAEGRRYFAEALDRYKADYAARNLTSKFSRSRRAYGTVQGMIEWETSSISLPGRAYPSMELGYRFRGESPYFSVFQRSAPNEYKQKDTGKSSSLQIFMYYTRAQAEALIKLFDQEYLMSFLNPARSSGASDTPAEDDYREYEEAAD